MQELIGLFKDSVLEIPVTLCAIFGFRRGETLGLKWKNVDLVNKTITISETLQQHVGGSYTSPPVVATDASPVTMTWAYIGELIFNMLVLVGTVKMSDRIIREMMGL